VVRTFIRQFICMNPCKFCLVTHVLFCLVNHAERWSQAENLGRYVKFIVDRHRFVKLRRDVMLIQKATRIWIRQRHKSDCVSNLDVSTLDIVNPAIASSTCQFDGLTVQLSSKTIISRSIHEQQLAATKIRSHFQGWLLRRTFLIRKQAIMKIQSNYRCLRCRRAFQQFSIAKKSAIVIQSCVRGWIVRRKVGRYRYLIGVLQVSYLPIVFLYAHFFASKYELHAFMN